MEYNGLKRYGIISNFPKREVVMLRGKGCFHKKCSFCDYYTDMSNDSKENFELNQNILNYVTGDFGELEVICSGSVQELDELTLNEIKKTCIKNNINKLSLECHYKYINTLSKLKDFYYPIEVDFRIGIETFDTKFREEYLQKEMGNISPKEIAKHFSYCNLLICIEGQTKEQILNDINIAQTHFSRICIGIFNENSTSIKKDVKLEKWFLNQIYPTLIENKKFHILKDENDYPLG